LSNSRPACNADLSALLHELNQPLTAILSNAQAAQRFLSDTVLDRAQMHDILEDIIADDKRAAAIIKRLGEALMETRRQMGEATMEEGLPR
jgi:C4-dicarboxylate-specific signal transduction histidine kinase